MWTWSILEDDVASNRRTISGDRGKIRRGVDVIVSWLVLYIVVLLALNMEDAAGECYGKPILRFPLTKSGAPIL